MLRRPASYIIRQPQIRNALILVFFFRTLFNSVLDNDSLLFLAHQTEVDIFN